MSYEAVSKPCRSPFRTARLPTCRPPDILWLCLHLLVKYSDMSSGQGDSSSNTRWETESLRLTAFVPPGTRIDGNRQWWAETVGHEPDEILSRSSLGQFQQVGDYQGQRLVWAANLDRMDLKLVIMPSQLVEFQDRILSMGYFDELIGPFKVLCTRLLSLFHPTRRIAFGSVLIIPVQNVREGYDEIARRVPYVQMPEGSSDFSFQVNIPKISAIGVDSMRINRLTKWSVMRREVLGIVLDSETPSVSSGTTLGLAQRLEMDINTPADLPDIIPVELLADVFAELVTQGIEISVNGI